MIDITYAYDHIDHVMLYTSTENIEYFIEYPVDV